MPANPQRCPSRWWPPAATSRASSAGVTAPASELQSWPVLSPIRLPCRPVREGTAMFNRIGIMGAGAIGSVVGGMLAKAGHDVTLIDQWPPHIEAMKQNGLTLSGTCGDHVV